MSLSKSGVLQEEITLSCQRQVFNQVQSKTSTHGPIPLSPGTYQLELANNTGDVAEILSLKFWSECPSGMGEGIVEDLAADPSNPQVVPIGKAVYGAFSSIASYTTIYDINPVLYGGNPPTETSIFLKSDLDDYVFSTSGRSRVTIDFRAPYVNDSVYVRLYDSEGKTVLTSTTGKKLGWSSNESSETYTADLCDATLDCGTLEEGQYRICVTGTFGGGDGNGFNQSSYCFKIAVEETVAEDCALLQSDGSVWTCTKTGKPVSSIFPSLNSRDEVRTLFIAPDVETVPEKVGFTHGGGSGRFVYEFPSFNFYLQFKNLETVHFLTDANGASSCNVLERRAFWNCRNLKEVVNFNKTRISSINIDAFRSCDKLQAISLPATVMGIGDYAFYNCASLRTIALPIATEDIGDYAFCDCTNLASVTIPTESRLKTVGSGAFKECISLKSLTFAKNLRLVEGSAFSRCIALKSVTFRGFCRMCG